MGALIRKYPAIIFGVVCVLGLAYVMLVPTPLQRQRKLEAHSLGNAHDVVLAARQYSREHGGVFPANLDLLIPNYLPDRTKLVSPLNPAEALGYTYTPPPKERTDSPDTVVMEDKFSPDKYHDRIVVYADAGGKLLPVQQ
jgi:hypothetical protein